MFTIDTDESFKEIKEMIDIGEAIVLSKENNIVTVSINKEVIKLELNQKYEHAFTDKKEMLIYGKNPTKNIVNISVKDEKVYIFYEKDTITSEVLDFKQWVLASKEYKGFRRLTGNQHYKYYTEFSYDEIEEHRKKFYPKDLFTFWNRSENYMVRNGYTYFKGLVPKEVSILSFDIETSGIVHDKNSRIFLISNTFRKDKKIIKRLFAYDEYTSDKEMLKDWANWVKDLDPSIMCGHNIIGYDLPYMDYCSSDGLNLGRDGSKLEFEDRTSKFRKDGSQSYDYNNPIIFGREVIDTMFLSIKYDIARKYETYGLKQIIKQEKLEKPGRTFYDAGTIKDNYTNPEEWAKIKAYAMDDADDALALFDLMGSSFFYMAQSIPKTFQMINNTATGSQINAMMVRSYLQEGHSISRGSEKEEFGGGISFGIPGFYKNAFKQDVASLYPSIMREYKVYDKKKDPNAYFSYFVETFTLERLKNKKLAKETKEQYYTDMEQSQKILINSFYGFMGAPGLNYNSMENAAFVTKVGRDILEKAMLVATGKDYAYWKSLAPKSKKDEESDEE